MTLRAVGGTVLVVEFLFYLFYRFFLIPRANQRTAPQPYRDYPLGERTRLLRRILARIKATCQVTNRCYRDVVRDFILQWFREIPKYAEAESVENLKQGDPEVKSKAGQNPSSLVVLSVPLLTKATTSSLDSSSMGSNSGSVDDQDSSGTDMNAAEYDSGERLDGTRGWTIPGITRKGTDVFFSWAFFGKELNDLSDEEVIELESFYSVIECECDGLRFTSLENGDEWGSTESMPPVRKHYAPRRLSLEDVNPIHRPLLLYIMIWLIKAVVCHGFLTLLGFRRIQSTSGLVAWYRPSRSLSNTKVANSTETRDFLPLLFFHGIAPAGLAFYVPMVLHLIRDGRAAYLFENAPITYCSAGFGALTEMQTIEGVEEILNRTSNYEGPLALMGHSFGSCQLTWLLESKLQKRIRLLVLLDPVTILLSEPDVMVRAMILGKVDQGAGLYSRSR